MKINKQEKIKQVEKLLEEKQEFIEELEIKADIGNNKQARLKIVELTEEIKLLFLELDKLQKEENRGEDNNMNKEVKMETRKMEYGIGEIIRGEERALQTTVDGATLIPEKVENSIVLKMEEVSPVFAHVRKLHTDSGEVRVVRESDEIEVGFVGEGENIAEESLKFDFVKLNQKRVGGALTLSNQLLNDSSIDLEDYVGNLLARRTARAIEKSILVGTGEEEFNGIIHDEFINKVEVTGEVSIDDLTDMYLAVHPEFLKNARFVMQRNFFNKIAKFKDNNNHLLLQGGVVNGKINYTLFGIPVEITEALPDTTPVVFGNLEEGVSMMIKRGAKLQKIAADTTQSLRGSALFVYDFYADSNVVNPQALVKMTVTA